jgi:two-component system LytT family response regulator
VTAPRYRVLLIDDEALSRRRLRQLLSAAPDFDVAGECDDARRAEELVRTLRPDVVFLDIRMPHLDGFGVQAALRDRVRHVVFVTAHPEHAVRAFDIAASDYLVKPVTQARFNAALDRLRRAAGGTGVERILLGGRQGGAAVAVADVVWLQARGAYVMVHLERQRHLVRESLAQLMDRLGAARFVRIHRSAGINLAHVTALKRAARGLTVELSNGARLPISRRKAGQVVELLRQAPLPARPQHEPTGGAGTR